MQRFTRLQKVLMSLISVILVLGCVMMGLRQNALSNLGYSAWTYIQYGLFEYPLESVGSMFSDVANLWHQYDDNQFLNKQLAQQRSYKTMYEDEQNKTMELEKLLDIKGEGKKTKTISARVIRRSPETWNQTVTISAGSVHKVQENMLVQTSEGAVGLVTDVQTTTSTVELLTSEGIENDIAVKMSLDDGKTIEGVIQSYDVERNEYRMVLYNNENNITNGQSVATSGMGGNYPSGILVGTVTEIEQDDNSIISTVYVRPVSNIQSFTYCLVVGSEDN